MAESILDNVAYGAALPQRSHDDFHFHPKPIGRFSICGRRARTAHSAWNSRILRNRCGIYRWPQR
jgi:hypothetical protein